MSFHKARFGNEKLSLLIHQSKFLGYLSVVVAGFSLFEKNEIMLT